MPFYVTGTCLGLPISWLLHGCGLLVNFCYGDQYASDMLLLPALGAVAAIIVGSFSVVISSPLSRDSPSGNAIVTAPISYGMQNILSFDSVCQTPLDKP